MPISPGPAWGRRHQARARWHHYATRLETLACWHQYAARLEALAA